MEASKNIELVGFTDPDTGTFFERGTVLRVGEVATAYPIDGGFEVSKGHDYKKAVFSIEELQEHVGLPVEAFWERWSHETEPLTKGGHVLNPRPAEALLGPIPPPSN